MNCSTCGHEHRDYVYGFTCKGCPCKEHPGRAEWEAEIEANMPDRGTAAQRHALAVRMIELCDDSAHWNLTHPNEEPIVVDTDIRKDGAKLTTRLVKGGTA